MAIEDTLYTEADIIALKQALKRNVRSSKTSDGNEVTFGSLAEGQAILRQMKREVYGGKRRSTVRTQEVTTSVGGRE